MDGHFQDLNGKKGLKNAPKWGNSLILAPDLALKWEEIVKMRLPWGGDISLSSFYSGNVHSSRMRKKDW
jgi:hypothetical protein